MAISKLWLPGPCTVFLFITQNQHVLYYSSDCSKELKCKWRILLSFAACRGLALSAHTKHTLGKKAASVLATWTLANHRSFYFNAGAVGWMRRCWFQREWIPEHKQTSSRHSYKRNTSRPHGWPESKSLPAPAEFPRVFLHFCILSIVNFLAIN